MDRDNDRRAFARHRACWSGKIFPIDEPWYIDCLVGDISEAGASVRMQLSAQLPPVVVLFEERFGLFLKSKVIWQRPHAAGLQFLDVGCRAERRAMLQRCFVPLRRCAETLPTVEPASQPPTIGRDRKAA